MECWRRSRFEHNFHGRILPPEKWDGQPDRATIWGVHQCFRVWNESSRAGANAGEGVWTSGLPSGSSSNRLFGVQQEKEGTP